MRAITLGLVILATGCTSSTVDDNVAYRRLGDAFTSEMQCLSEGNFAPCYQTLTLCASGRVTMDLANRPMEGAYEIHDNYAVADFLDMRVEFDLDAHWSAQLPGRNPWVVVEPIVYDCAE